MKTLLLFGLTLLPAICFSQVVDTAAVILEVDSLIKVSRAYSGKREFEKAFEINAAAEKLSLEKLGRETVSYGSACFYHGRALYLQGNYTEAEKWYIESKAIRGQVLGKEHLDYAWSLINLAVLYHKMGRYEAAEPLYVEAKVIRGKSLGNEHPDYAQSVFSLAVLYSAMGRYDAAEPLLLEAKAIREKVLGREHPDYAYSLNSLANLYSEIGRYETAEPLFLESQAIREKLFGKEHPDYANSLNNLANLYFRMGRYDAAEPLYLEANAIRKSVLGKEHPIYARSLSNLAILYLKMGRYEAAEPLFLDVSAIRENTLGKEHSDYAMSLSNLANVYMAMDRYEAVEPLYLEAKAIYEKAFGKEHPDYANNLNNLALLYSITGRFQEAEPLFLESKAILEKIFGKEHPSYASCLNCMADFYSNFGRYEAAEPLYLESKTIQEKVLGKEHQEYANGLINLANLYSRMGQDEAAEPLYIEASSLQRNLIAKSSQHLSEQELSAYHRLFLQNLAEYFSFAQRSPTASLKRGISASPSGGDSPSAQTTAYKNPKLSGGCYDNALFHKGFLLTASQQLKQLADSDPTSAKQFEVLTAYQRSLSKEYSKSITERQNVTDLEDKVNTLQKELARVVSGYEDALRQVSWQEVREKLQPGEVAIEFIQYQFYNQKPCDSIYYTALVLLPGDKAPMFVPLFEEREIAQLLEGAKGRNINGINALYRSGGQKSLYDLIWKPLDGLLNCSPSGLLHRLNLGAIPTGKGQTFSELHKLVLLGSTRQLVVPNAFKTAGNSAYVAGGIRYDWDSTNVVPANTDLATRGMATPNELPFQVDSTSRGGSWDYLPASATEAIEISKILKAQNFVVQLDTGYAATEESFKHLGTNQPSPRTILLATHGFFFPDPKPDARERKIRLDSPEPVFKTSNDPLIRSGLVLSGGQQTWRTGKGRGNREDGILTAYEISQMDLSGTELVVLSACETGLGDIVGNEGVYGLQRAVKIAGAKYLIMSLWKVNDNSTNEFMTEFYRQWLKKELEIPEAFHVAQKNMKVKYKDMPYHWAGFVLIE